MKKFEKIVIAVVLIQLLLIIGICNSFEVDDMTLAKGSVYSFNKGWTLIRENGTVTELDNLPYTAQCKANERIIIENRIPRKYQGYHYQTVGGSDAWYNFRGKRIWKRLCFPC